MMIDETEPVALKSVSVQKEHHDQREQESQWSEKNKQRCAAVAHQSKEQNLHHLLQQWEHVDTEQKLCVLSDLRNKLVQHLHNCCCYCCCCWMCHTRVSAERCQSKRISHTRDCDEEVEEENKTENHILTSNKNLIYKSYLNDMKTTC